MQEMIDERKIREKKDERHDLFSLLLDASEAETDGKQKLVDSDIIGLFIGRYLTSLTHLEQVIYSSSYSLDMRYVLLLQTCRVRLMSLKTTAHTMAFALGMLALYQDEQEILYQHVKSVTKDGRIPVRELMAHI